MSTSGRASSTLVTSITVQRPGVLPHQLDRLAQATDAGAPARCQRRAELVDRGQRGPAGIGAACDHHRPPPATR
ncbi:hypothetical protein [Microbacterium sp. EF45047]|uniref:hypothetical protein n=1 Tax=Microbacterium sp. EF45047 TaxID=2809708 RepID=UPI00234B9776|nr:hypothetical protein [Microbacterium sp. EF45047]WCM55509.1 hypothetical protein JRG78_11370 [Microbacterium sp. EF45047]